MTKTAIVTGVTGQMGSYVAEFLLQQGLHVVGTVRRLSVNNHRNVEHLKGREGFSLAPMDLGDPHSINALVATHKPAYFINCAANSFVGSSWDYPEQHIEYNMLGVQRQLEAIKRFSPHTRYLNFGSSEEFGDVVYSPQDEKHPARARSPYGASKIGARQIVKVYRESFGLYAIQCWCFNYESERRGDEFVSRKITLGVARIAAAIKEGRPFEPIELGNLDAKRDWSHAEDFVDGIWRMVNQVEFNVQHLRAQGILIDYEPDPVPGEYVLASGETHTVREFVEKAFAAAGIGGIWMGVETDEVYWYNTGPRPLASPECTLVRINPAYYRPAEVDLLQGDASRARAQLGWSPKVSFDELVTRMVRNDCAAAGVLL